MLAMLRRDDATCPTVIKRRRMSNSTLPTSSAASIGQEIRRSLEGLFDEEDRASFEERGFQWEDFPTLGETTQNAGHTPLSKTAGMMASAATQEMDLTGLRQIPGARGPDSAHQDQVLDFVDRPSSERLALRQLSVFIRLDEESDVEEEDLDVEGVTLWDGEERGRVGEVGEEEGQEGQEWEKEGILFPDEEWLD